MDYDVAVTGLSSPPAAAVLTQYRPAVSVRNNGLHNAIAAGYIRIYSAGLRVFESEVYSGTLAPSASGTADAVDYWTPEHEGTYIVQGYVTTPLDMVEPNNNLAPVTIIVSGAEPPVPPTVPLHAAQHEEGGSDPINVDGLPGVLADRQLPSAHAAQHQAGQSDVLNVSGLAGVLGDAQTPKVHGNAHHDPDMTTAAELLGHAGSSAAHTAATNLANRETTGPETGLVKGAQLASSTEVADPGDNPNKAGLRVGRDWGPVNAVHHAAKHAAGGLDPITVASVTTGIERTKIITPALGTVTIVTSELTAAQAKPGTACRFALIGTITTAGGVGQTVTFTLFHQNGGTSLALAACTIPVAANKAFTFHFEGSAGIGIGALLAAIMHGEVTETGTGSEIHSDVGYLGLALAPATDSRFFVAAFWTLGNVASTCTVSNAIASGVVRP